MFRLKSISIIFVCCLCIPLINMFFRIIPDDPVSDFRILADYPEYGTKIKKFPQKFQEYFHDNFAFRNKLIGLNGDVHYSLLKTSISDRVIIGKRGWLYFTDEGIMDDFHGKIKINDNDMKNTCDFFVELDKYIEIQSKGRTKLIVVVCPNPQTIYPEYLPEHEKYIFGNGSRLDQYIDYFKQNNGIKILDIRPALLKAKENSQEWLYYSNDSHWNILGAEVAFRELINCINELGIPVQIPQYTINKINTLSGDLTRIIAAKSIPQSSFYSVVFNDISVQPNSDWNDLDYKQTSTNPNGLSIVIFGDSYSINLRALIGGTFNQSYFLRSSGEVFENVNNALLTYKPDVIVFEIVERGLYTWSNFIPPQILFPYKLNGFYNENTNNSTKEPDFITGNASIIAYDKTATHFSLTGYYPPGWPINSITVTINNNESLTMDIVPGLFTLELDFENKFDDIQISIKTKKTFIPKNEGWNEDGRELAVIVTSWSLSSDKIKYYDEIKIDDDIFN